ncbi:MAG: prolipoprotein diacylglyceryl transferase [Bacteroidota bacterium]
MINPVIYTFHIFGYEFPLRWYGVIVMIGVIVASLVIERELNRRGERGDRIWDILIWVLPAGIVGARLWYVANATIGGNRFYIENPIQIINIPQGGLHIFGGFLFGAAVLLTYLRQNKRDPWIYLDAAAPALLIGQAIGRIANFINQELYGPPTTLPWGIPISAEHRLPIYPVDLYPVATTRFHPTFAYEIIWNLCAAGFLLWLSRRYKDQVKPGTIFAGWLVLAGLGRFWIEFFRPDQPKIGGLGLSYSAVISVLMAATGVIMLLVRYKKLHLKIAENWEEQYHVDETPVQESMEEVDATDTTAKKESLIHKKAREKIAAREAKKQSAGTPGENKS